MILNPEKRKLNKYGKEVKRVLKLGKMLNTKQKERLSFYANRVLAYCRNQTIIYSKNERVKDKDLIPNAEQSIEYKEMFDRFNKLAVKIKEDDVLSVKVKQELSKCLQCLIGHLKGKQNVGNKYAKKIK